MRTVYAMQFDLAPTSHQAAAGVFADIKQKVIDWCEAGCKRKWSQNVHVSLDGSTHSPSQGHYVKGLEIPATDYEWFNLEWTHPDDSDSSTSWMTTCTVAREENAVQIALLIRLSSSSMVLRPVQYCLGRPRLITDLLDAYQASLEGWTIPKDVELLASPDIQGFVDSKLLSSNRNLPVVVVSPIARNETYVTSAASLFAKLRGYSHVVKLADKWAAFKLTETVDKTLSCFDGAVRLYWPGFTLQDSPYNHKLFMADTIRHQDASGQFEANLFRTLSAVASYRYADGQTISRVRKLISDDEKRKVEDLRSQVKSGTVLKHNLETQLLESLEQIEKITSERDQARADLAAQRAAWAEFQHASSGMDDHPDEERTAAAKHSSVHAAVVAAKSDFRESLIFLDTSIESAKESPYKDPDRVYQILEALASVALEWREKRGQLGRSWNDAIAEYGFDLRDQISQTSRGKYASEYHFAYKGQKLLFQKHITIGAKQADKCLSVHYHRDDNDLVLVIGHCGRHLSNTST